MLTEELKRCGEKGIVFIRGEQAKDEEKDRLLYGCGDAVSGLVFASAFP